LVDFKGSWKILISLNHCFQRAHSQTIPQLVFIDVIQAGEVLSTSAEQCFEEMQLELNTLHNN